MDLKVLVQGDGGLSGIIDEFYTKEISSKSVINAILAFPVESKADSIDPGVRVLLNDFNFNFKIFSNCYGGNTKEITRFSLFDNIFV